MFFHQSFAQGGQPPQRGSRAMVETIAVTDGELTALSALSGHQLSSTEIESLASIQAELDRLNAAHGVQEVEDAVCVTVPPEDSMEVEESQQTQDVEMPDSTTPTSAVVVESAPSAIARAAVLPSVVSAAAASTSYVVIQSSPGNRVLTTNSNVQAKKGTQIMGRLSTGAPQIQQVQLKAAVNTSAGASSGTGPPPLVSRGATFTVSGVRALNPGSRPPVVTKVVLPRQGGNPHVMAIPISDSKTMDSHRIVTLGGPHVKVLSGGMKVATINQSDLKELPENVATGSPARPLVVQTRQILSPSKVQQILPSSPGGKGLVVNRVISSSGPRVTVIPQGAKSPAKILPAPISTSGSCTTQSGSTISPQKVIIRQTPLKPMTSGGQQVLRISTSTQPVSSTSSAFQSVQVAGRTMQYVRLVSIPSSSTTTTVTSGGVGKGSTVLTLAPTPVSQVGGVKMIPITPVATPRPVGTKTTGQKIMIPASIAMTQIRAPVPTSVIASTTTTASITSIDSSNIVMLSTAAAQVSRNKIIAQTPIAQLSPQPVVSQEQVREEKPTPKLQITTAPQQPPQPKQKPSKQVKEESQEEAEQQTVQPGQPAPPPQQVQVPALIKSAASKITSEPNGIRPRKPCNCTKSQCLKLYCDCFANGEFCYQCNCNCCFNNLEHEEDRQRAIRSCLERNPNAFRPKIGKGQVGDGRRHNKGCNCKRSGCLKNYCECYEAKIACSNNCKCVGCRNIEEDLDKRSLRDLMEVAERESRLIQAPVPKKKTSLIPSDSSAKHEAAAALLTPGIVAASVRAPTPTGTEIGTSTSSLADEEDDEDEPPTKTYRRPLNLMSDEVVNATCQCLLATAEKAEKSKLKEEDAERLIIEEFGRCLVEIIASVTSRTDDSHSLCE